jgi:hypothetical protein
MAYTYNGKSYEDSKPTEEGELSFDDLSQVNNMAAPQYDNRGNLVGYVSDKQVKFVNELFEATGYPKEQGRKTR